MRNESGMKFAHTYHFEFQQSQNEETRSNEKTELHALTLELADEDSVSRPSRGDASDLGRTTTVNNFSSSQTSLISATHLSH